MAKVSDTDFRAFKCDIVGITAYSQSKMLTGEKKETGEDWDAFEARVWKKKMHTSAGLDDPNSVMQIPGQALSQALTAYAQLRGEKVAGKGNKTWTKHFLTGARAFGDVKTSVKIADVYPETNMCDSQGNKGSSGGTRVPRTFPVINPGWKASAVFLITDKDITADKFEEYLSGAGVQIGVGRFRPQNGGHKGMFRVESIVEVDPSEAFGI